MGRARASRVDGVGLDTQVPGRRSGHRHGCASPMDAWVSWSDRALVAAAAGGFGEEVAFGVIRDGATTTLDAGPGPIPARALRRRAPISLIVFGAGVPRPRVDPDAAPDPRHRAAAAVRRGGRERRRHRGAGKSASSQPTSACPGRCSRLRRRFTLQHRLWSTIVHILVIYPVRSRSPGAASCDPGPVRRPPARVLRARGSGLARRAGRRSTGVDRLAACMATVGSGMLVLVILATIAGYRRTSGVRRRQVRWIARHDVVRRRRDTGAADRLRSC